MACLTAQYVRCWLHGSVCTQSIDIHSDSATRLVSRHWHQGGKRSAGLGACVLYHHGNHGGVKIVVHACRYGMLHLRGVSAFDSSCQKNVTVGLARPQQRCVLRLLITITCSLCTTHAFRSYYALLAHSCIIRTVFVTHIFLHTIQTSVVETTCCQNLSGVF